MSKMIIFDGITEDTISDTFDRSPGNAAVFVQIAPVGHGRVRVESSADGGLSWLSCRVEDDAPAVFNSDCFCALQEHGGNTVMRVIADQTSGSTTGITVYMTIDE